MSGVVTPPMSRSPGRWPESGHELMIATASSQEAGGSHPRTDGSFIDGCRGPIISIMFRRRQHRIKTLLTTHNIGKILFLVPCHGNIKCIIRVGGGAFSTYEGAFQNTR